MIEEFEYKYDPDVESLREFEKEYGEIGEIPDNWYAKVSGKKCYYIKDVARLVNQGHKAIAIYKCRSKTNFHTTRNGVVIEFNPDYVHRGKTNA